VREIIFCYDGDNAGIKAAWRALENALPILRDGMIARFLFLPGGEDPDTMVRKEGKEKFEQRLDSAMPLSDFLFQHLEEEADTSTQEGKARLAELAKPLLAKMPDSVFRDLLLEQLASLVGVAVSKLSAASSAPANLPAQKPQSPNRSRKTSLSGTRDAVALLLQYPDLAKHAEIPDDFANSPLQGLDLLHTLYHTLKDSPGLSSSALLERWRGKDEFPILEKLLQHNVQGTDDSETRIEVYLEVIQHLIKKYQDYRFELLHDKMASGESLSTEELAEYRRHTGAR
jgi:DNA primase